MGESTASAERDPDGRPERDASGGVDPATEDRREASEREPSEREPRGSPRRLRALPTAVTPITAGDLLAGVAEHARGRGREALRDAVRERLDGETAATYSSYRRALAAALRELDAATAPTRSTVLVPAFCSSDFAAAVNGVGLDVRRYDVSARTLAADLESLRSRLDDDALAVVAVNPLGYGSDVAGMRERCDDAGAFLVEALGYALGATYEDRPLGTYGDLSVLNFQQGKPIPVGGGMVLTRNPALSVSDADRPSARPNLGALSGYAALGRPRPFAVYRRARAALAPRGEPASTHPDAKGEVAYDGPFRTMSNFQGAVACRVLNRLPETRRRRAANARYYREAFRAFEHADLIEPLAGVGDHQWVRYPLLVASNELRGEIRRTLEKEGVQTPLLYNWPKVRRREFPGARALQRRVLPLPTHPYVDERDRRRIVATVEDVAAAYADRR